MKLVFFDTPDFAVPALNALYESPHDVLGVVTSPDRKSGRGLKIQSSSVKKSAENFGIPIFQPEELNSDEFISTIKQINPDIYVVVAYKILPESILTIPARGAVNLHASLLPKYRGAAPVQHAILHGESQTGLSTFLIKKKVDTGDLLLQKTFYIESSTTTGEALEKLSYIGADLIIETLDGLSNNTITPIKQDDKSATFAPKINIEDCKINWNNSAENIHNQIRAFTPTPGAYTLYKNKRIKLFRSKIRKRVRDVELQPGHIKYKAPELLIGTGSKTINIKDIQLEGKKRLTASQFILGFPEIIGGSFD